MRPTRNAPLALALCFVLGTPLLAQDSKNPARAGKRSLLPRDREIALARSAAPAAVSDSASIWVFTDSGYALAAKGTNGAACYVSRSWPASVEPHCFDAEGAATIMRVHMREVELLHRGMSLAEADRTVGAELSSGALRLPRRPAMSYMMSAGQSLISDDGRAAGAWKPHVMIYYPYLDARDLYAAPPDPAAGMIAGAGSATSSIMILVPAFVQVREPRP